MIHYRTIVIMGLVLAMGLGLSNPGTVHGDDKRDMGGWEIDGKVVFMASKIKKGTDWEFKVRLTKDGTPFWTMSPEQLAKERASK